MLGAGTSTLCLEDTDVIENLFDGRSVGGEVALMVMRKPVADPLLGLDLLKLLSLPLESRRFNVVGTAVTGGLAAARRWLSVDAELAAAAALGAGCLAGLMSAGLVSDLLVSALLDRSDLRRRGP